MEWGKYRRGMPAAMGVNSMNDFVGYDAALAEDWTFEPAARLANPALDRLTMIAANLFKAPIAHLMLIDGGHLHTASHFGPPLADLSGYRRLCDETIRRQGPVVSSDGGTASGWFVGVPMLSRDGKTIGALCVTDRASRLDPATADLTALQELAAIAADLIAAQTAAQTAAQSKAALATPAQAAQIAPHVVTQLVPHPGMSARGMRADIAQAAGLDGALESLMFTLGRSKNALAGALWRRTPGQPVFERLRCFGVRTTDKVFISELGTGVIAAALDRDKPVTVMLDATGDQTRQDPLIVASFGNSAKQVLVVPFARGDDAHVMLLGFETSVDLTKTVDEVAGVLSRLRPGIAHKADEERLRLLCSALDMAAEGVTIMRLDPLDSGNPSTVIYANHSFCEMTGYSADELVGKTNDLLNGPETSRDSIKAGRAALLTGQKRSMQLVRHRKDGTPFAVELEAAPITEPDGSIKHFVVMHRDVTRRQETLDQLHAVSSSFKLMFDQNPLPMWAFDAKTLQFLMVNQAAIDFYGWPRERFLTKHVQDVCVDEVLDSKGLAGQRSMSEPGVYTHIRADGAIVRMSGVTQATSFDGRDAVFTVMWEVTDEEKTRAEQQRNYQLLRELTDELSAKTTELTDVNRLAQLGIWRLSADRTDMQWSDEIYTLIGRQRSEFPATFENWLAVMHPDDRDLYTRSLPVKDASGGSRFIEARMLRSDGQLRRVRIEFRPAHPTDATTGGSSGDLIGYVQDATERWETQQSLLRSERLAILGHLAGGIAHDFNNLLTVVTLNLEEVIAELPETGELRDILIAALRSAQRGSELTNQLLAYARHSPLAPKATSLDQLFQSILPVVRRAIGKKHPLRLTLEDGGCTPLVDPTQLQNAIVNLALNASEAMPDGGEVVIEANQVRLPSVDYPVTEPASGPFAMISVTDRGCGIPPDLVSRIFEPFYTTKAPGTGGGLGLSSVDGFIAQSGGRILVESEVGRGTTMRLFLPLPTIEATAADSPPEGAAGEVRRPRALVVEDQPAVLATVSRMFKQLGYDVCGVENAADALAELDRDDDFDILFSDLGLPGDLDGIALSKEIARRAPKVRSLLTSGSSQHNAASESAPGFSILVKPYSRQDLKNRLADIMDGTPAALMQ
jgi:PAS domain S-box-containing protein